jgi:hypothetical protein
MDLSTILKNIRKGKYTSLISFDRDMSLVFQNCIAYNGIQSEFGKVGKLDLSVEYLYLWMND